MVIHVWFLSPVSGPQTGMLGTAALWHVVVHSAYDLTLEDTVRIQEHRSEKRCGIIKA